MMPSLFFQVTMDERIVLGFSLAFARVMLRYQERLDKPWVWIQGAILGIAGFFAAAYGASIPESWACLAGLEACSFLASRFGLKSFALGLAAGLAVLYDQTTMALRLAASGAACAAAAATLKAEMVGAIGAVVFAALPWMTASLFPVVEFAEAFDALESLHATEESKKRFRHSTLVVVLVGIHAQLAVGWAGVEYLRSSQRRKNGLIDGVGNGKLTAKEFASKKTARHVALFAFPFLLQRISMGIVYELGFRKLSFGVSRALRVETIMARPSALSVLGSSQLTLEAHGEAAEATVRRIYELGSRKVFSLPKIALLPSLLAAHPLVFAGSVPLFVAFDGLKARSVASLTTAIEATRSKARAATSKRSRVELHDASRAGSIELVGADEWVEKQWVDLSRSIEHYSYTQTALETVSRYVRWLYWLDFLTPAIEVALAGMLQRRIIDTADLWVIARALEDALDLLLTRSRAEAELAALRTDVQKIVELVADANAFRSNARTTANLTCSWSDDGSVQVSGLAYERGSARARVDSFRATRGETIALTGPNSGGKSTLLSLLSVCRGLSPPQGATVTSSLARIALPKSGHIAHLPQKPFCPLHMRPLDWLSFGGRGGDDEEGGVTIELASKLLDDLDFYPTMNGGKSPEEDKSPYLALLDEHDDFCGSLSGGQLIKFELVRQIFAPVSTVGRCPAVVLLDETLAPLDPRSKRKVQRLLTELCPDAITLVVYHSDAQGETAHDNTTTTTTAPSCVDPAGFFTDVAHFLWTSAPDDDAAATAGGSYLQLTRVGTCSK